MNNLNIGDVVYLKSNLETKMTVRSISSHQSHNISCDWLDMFGKNHHESFDEKQLMKVPLC